MEKKEEEESLLKIEDNLKEQQEAIIDQLRLNLMDVLVANFFYLIYQLVKPSYIIYILRTADEYCYQLEIWLIILVFFDLIFAVYFIAAIATHLKIYFIKKKNILNQNIFKQFISENNMIHEHNSQKLSVNKSLNVKDNLVQKDSKFGMNNKNFLIVDNHKYQSQQNYKKQDEESKFRSDQVTSQQSGNKKEGNFMNSDFLKSSQLLAKEEDVNEKEVLEKEVNNNIQLYNQSMLMSKKYNENKLLVNLNYLDYFSYLGEINLYPDRMYQILMLTRHGSQFAYFTTYFYGLIIF